MVLSYWHVGRFKFSSLEANLGVGRALLVYPILFSFSSERSLDMTKMLLTGT